MTTPIELDSSYGATNGSGSRSMRVWWGFAVVIVVGLAAILRHNTLSGRPFWLDEAWVADWIRGRPQDLLWMAPPTPPLWEALLRLVPRAGDPERYRVVPFLFSVATVVPAAALGARLKRGRGFALAAAVALAVLPHLLVRQDLKQYTAEAFVALTLMVLAARLEVEWSIGRLILFGLVAVLAVTVANTAIFVAAALLGGVWVSLVAQRRFRESFVTVAAAAMVLAANLAVLLGVTLTGPVSELRDYWGNTFIPTGQGLGETLRFVAGRLHGIFGLFHVPWWVSGGLMAAGVITLWRARIRTAALVGPAVLVLLMFAAAARRYPFMDLRTSTFALSILGLYGGIGAAAILAWLWKRKAAAVIGVLALVVLCVPVASAARSAMRPSVPLENMPKQVAYVRSHQVSGDVIVVSFPGAFAFSYYWPERPIFREGPPRGSAVNFTVTYPPADLIVVAAFRARSDIDAALAKAFAMVRPPGRVWVVLSHDTIVSWTRRFPPGARATRIPLKGIGSRNAVFVLTP